MEKHQIFEDCEICGRRFEFGHGRYRGQKIAKYNLMVCSICFESNWDGWGPALEAKFEAHLKKHGIALPARNAAGYYPRGM